MASDDSDGFLAKVARLVRRPAAGWPDSDAGPSGGLSDRQALKEAIERKKRNDFVRKREFDMLRAIRRREQGAREREERPSFFQSSHPSRGDGREMTKRKIDEIEAQMSTHWWQQKPGEERVPERLQAPATRGATEGPAPAHLQAQAFENSDWGGTVQHPLLPTQPAQEDQWPVARHSQRGSTQAGPSSLPVTFSDDSQHTEDTTATADTLPASGTGWAGLAREVGRAVPALEAAAVHFIHNDLAQAERLLKEALAQAGAPENRQLVRVVLLDFYRATGRQREFEACCAEAAAQPGAAPELAWRSLAEGDGAAAAQAAALVVWTCPAQLDARAVAALKAHLDTPANAHVMDWSALSATSPDTATQLLAVLDERAGQAGTLHWVGHQHLRRRLQASTPSGRRENHAVWWRLRLAVLRLLGQQDEFDLTALDYCVTYGVTPPDWELPQASRELHDSWPPEKAPLPNVLALNGHLQGDIAPVLAALQTQAGATDPLRIDCSGLLQVDLVAASALLQWGKALQARRRRVVLEQLHRLMAVALQVVGVDEAVQLRVRAD